MKIDKPVGLVSGFHMDSPDSSNPELRFLGEQWAPQNYKIKRHAHEVWEFYLQMNGTSVWCDSNLREYRCPKAAFFAPSPGLEHWLKQTQDPRHHFLFAAIDVEKVLSESIPELHKVWSPNDVIFCPDAESCIAPFRALIREVTSDSPFRSTGIRVALVALILAVARLETAKTVAQALVFQGHPSVDLARRTLDDHPIEPWTLYDLGRLCGLSPNHLIKLFKAETGESPYRYLLKRRLERAKELLGRAEFSITSIAFESGFRSSQHFAKIFRQEMGVSASEYRRKTQGRLPVGAKVAEPNES